MPAVDRALLRLATYELRWGPDIAPASRSTRRSSWPRSCRPTSPLAFVNGVLGRIAAATSSAVLTR